MLDEYRQRCLASQAFQGFIFLPCLATEDRPGGPEHPAPLLARKLVLWRPREPEDFDLCLYLAFLENCDTNDKGSVEAVGLMLQAMRPKLNLRDKTRNLLFRGCRWTLNTLRFWHDLSPWEENFILPRFYLYRRLSQGGSPPTDLLELRLCSAHGLSGRLAFLAPYGARAPAVEDETADDVRKKAEPPVKALLTYWPSPLNAAYRHPAFSEALAAWWTHPDKTTEELLYRKHFI